MASGAAVGYALWVYTNDLRLQNRQGRCDRRSRGFVLGFQQRADDRLWQGRGQAIGVFVIPMFVITNFPALFVLGRMSPLYFAWGFVAPVLFGFIASWLWKAGLKHYASGGN